jgi:hypothetical protein
VVGSSVVGSSVAVQRALIEAFIAALVALSRRCAAGRWPLFFDFSRQFADSPGSGFVLSWW